MLLFAAVLLRLMRGAWVPVSELCSADVARALVDLRDPDRTWVQTELLHAWFTALTDITVLLHPGRVAVAEAAGNDDVPPGGEVVWSLQAALSWLLSEDPDAARGGAVLPAAAPAAAAPAVPVVVGSQPEGVAAVAVPASQSPQAAVQRRADQPFLFLDVWRALSQRDAAAEPAPPAPAHADALMRNYLYRYPLWVRSLSALHSVLSSSLALPPVPLSAAAHQRVAIFRRLVVSGGKRQRGIFRTDKSSHAEFLRREAPKVRTTAVRCSAAVVCAVTAGCSQFGNVRCSWGALPCCATWRTSSACQ